MERLPGIHNVIVLRLGCFKYCLALKVDQYFTPIIKLYLCYNQSINQLVVRSIDQGHPTDRFDQYLFGRPKNRL